MRDTLAIQSILERTANSRETLRSRHAAEESCIPAAPLNTDPECRHALPRAAQPAAKLRRAADRGGSFRGQYPRRRDPHRPPVLPRPTMRAKSRTTNSPAALNDHWEAGYLDAVSTPRDRRPPKPSPERGPRPTRRPERRTAGPSRGRPRPGHRRAPRTAPPPPAAAGLRRAAAERQARRRGWTSRRGLELFAPCPCSPASATPNPRPFPPSAPARRYDGVRADPRT